MASDSTRTTLSISRETRIKLSKLRKGNQTYDSLISEMADQALQVSEDDENWDVEKVLNHLKVVDKRGRYHSIDEVFPDVWDCIQWRSTEIHLNRYKERAQIKKIILLCLSTYLHTTYKRCNKKLLKGSDPKTYRLHISMRHTPFYWIDNVTWIPANS